MMASVIRQYIDGELDVEYTPPAGKINSVDVVFRIGKSQTGLGWYSMPSLTK